MKKFINEKANENKKANDELNFVHNAGNTYNDIITVIDVLARKASAGTLKKIYAASAHQQILKYMNALQSDFKLADNMGNDEKLKTTFSDAYDIYLIAYEYLYNKILVETYNPQDTITEKLKNGKEKVRTVYQWTCVQVRKYIYNNKSIENNGKFVYIEDLKQNENETAENALDREYIRMNKYDGIDNYNDYIDYNNMLSKLDLTDRQTEIIILRMRGLSVNEIAKKYGVKHNTISTQLQRIRDKVRDTFPDMLRGFDLTHI